MMGKLASLPCLTRRQPRDARKAFCWHGGRGREVREREVRERESFTPSQQPWVDHGELVPANKQMPHPQISVETVPRILSVMVTRA